MIFWVYMFVMDLLIPATMIGFGKLFMKRAPRDINYVFGYRSSMSMKNRDTWVFAHRYCGKLWWTCGLALLPVTAVSLLLVLGRTADVVGTVGGAVCLLQIIPLAGVIIPTERALKKTFDQNGRRRQSPVEPARQKK